MSSRRRPTGNWGLRDYGVNSQIGLEKTPEEYVAKMTEIFREVRRVLRKDGTMWLNLGDSYWGGGNYRGTNEETLSAKQGSNRGARGMDAIGRDTFPPTCRKPINGAKPKDLVGIPWLVAFALRADGWYLRSDIIWSKPNPIPESVRDRPTKAHEYIFLMSKSDRYFYDAKAIAEERTTEHEGHVFGGNKYTPESCGKHSVGSNYVSNGCRNKRSVWSIATQPFPDAHFATFPTDLVKVCLMAGTNVGDVILDPFIGSGTVAVVAKNAGRNYVGIELNPAYVTIAEKRLKQEVLSL